jgi:hypothetical protein
VDAGANVHAVDYKQRGVLQYAVGQRRMVCLPLLLEQGANPNHRDAKGQTPMVALLAKEGICQDGALEVVLTLLLKAGADRFSRITLATASRGCLTCPRSVVRS